MTSDFAIETEALGKVYRSRWRGKEIRAVANVSLRVPRGVKFGLLGANGAGKTTFVKMLLSAVHPTSGSARLFGRDSATPEARFPVGYLPENHRFPTYMTGASLLDFYSSLSALTASERRVRIPELLEVVGLRDWASIRIQKYSKGMLQRLGLAQALMNRPQLLILDEPTDGVDPVGRRHIRDILNDLTHTGVTVFLNSHLLSEVESFCDHVAILRRGELALQGEMSKLLARGGYRITALDPPRAALDRITALAAGVSSTASGIEIQATTREQANQIIDELRAASALIESVQPTTNSLEDVFIRTNAPEQAA